MVGIGLDASTTCTGYGLFTKGKLVRHGVIRPDKKLEVMDRIDCMSIEIERLIDFWKVKDCCVEMPVAVPSNSWTTLTLGILHGHIMQLCADKRLTWRRPSPNEWRGRLGWDPSLGREKLKELAVETANELFDLDLKKKDHDEAEGIMVYHSMNYVDYEEEAPIFE